MLLRKAHQAGGSESFKTVGKRPPSFGCTQMRRTSVAPSHPHSPHVRTMGSDFFSSAMGPSVATSVSKPYGKSGVGA